MAIKHSTTKAAGDTGLASEWNDDHVIEDGTIEGKHLEDPLTDDHEFSNFPTTPNTNPTADREVANKMYVDSEAVLRKGWAGYDFENGGGWTTKKTISIPAGWCHKRSMIVVRLLANGTGQVRVLINDGSHNSTSVPETLAAAALGQTITICQPPLQPELRYWDHGAIDNVAFQDNYIGELMNLDMFEDAFTIQIQVNRTGGGSFYIEWGVFIIQGS